MAPQTHYLKMCTCLYFYTERRDYCLYHADSLCSNLKLLKISIWIPNVWRQVIKIMLLHLCLSADIVCRKTKDLEGPYKIVLFLFLCIIKTHSSHTLPHTHWHTSVIDHLFVSGPVYRLWNAVQCTSPLGILTASLFFFFFNCSEATQSSRKSTRSTSLELLLKKLGVKIEMYGANVVQQSNCIPTGRRSCALCNFFPFWRLLFCWYDKGFLGENQSSVANIQTTFSLVSVWLNCAQNLIYLFYFIFLTGDKVWVFAHVNLVK